MPDLLTGFIGGAIVLVVASDIFRSLLVPRASARWLRVAPLLTLALFSGWQTLSGQIANDRLRQTVRASLAPFMLVLLLAVWVALLIFGFGLIFWAHRADFVPRFHGLGDALYAAGSAFSTLGVNAHVTGSGTRLIVLICATAGLAIVTVVATFLISLQAGFGRREALVLRLEAHVTLPPAGIAILETYASEQVVERLGAFFDAWEQWAAEVAISHRAFPILIFFRSNDSRCEWLAALGAVLDAAALLDATVADAPPAARATAHFVLRTGARLVNDIAAQFHIAAPDGFEAVDTRRFHRHRQRLAAAGYPLIEDADAALARFVDRRGAYAAGLSGLGQRLRVDVDDRGADDEDSMPIGDIDDVPAEGQGR